LAMVSAESGTRRQTVRQSLPKSIGIGQMGALTCARTFPKRGADDASEN
jgi:hypothetical protein